MNNLLAAQDARDRYNADILRATYDRKRGEILASGDDTRMRLLREHDDRERKRMGRAA